MRPSPSGPAVLRETAAQHRQAAAMWKRQGDRFFADSEDVLAKATECYARERALLNEADDIEAVDEAKEHWGKNVRLVKENAA